MNFSHYLTHALTEKHSEALWLEHVGKDEPRWSLKDYIGALHTLPVDSGLESKIRLWARPSWLYTDHALSLLDSALHDDAFSTPICQALWNTLGYGKHESLFFRCIHSCSILISLYQETPRSLKTPTPKRIEYINKTMSQFALSRHIAMPIYLWDIATQKKLIEKMIPSTYIYGGYYPCFLPSSMENDIFCLARGLVPDNPSDHYMVLSLMVNERWPSGSKVRMWLEEVQRNVPQEIELNI